MRLCLVKSWTLKECNWDNTNSSKYTNISEIFRLSCEVSPAVMLEDIVMISTQSIPGILLQPWIVLCGIWS